MAWQDRPYSRDQTPSRFGPLMWLVTGSVPLFTAFGIRVRMHALMILYIVVTLLLSETPYGIGGFANAVTSLTILFGSVLLHEFGHCFGARAVGGEADEILMWPLGGLAFSRPPHRPWPSFFTTAAGPAVNAFICLGSGVILELFGHAALPWFPFRHGGLLSFVPHEDTFSYYLWWVFAVNYELLLFNLLLLFYPFDGGRMVQELLWVRLGYFRSMLIAIPIGFAGAIAVGAFGLAVWDFNLVLIGLFGFYTCFQQRQLLREMGPDAFEDEGGGLYAAAYEPLTPRRKRKGRLATWAGRRAVAKARAVTVAAQQEREAVDAILAKVSRGGMASLTRGERRTLRKATEARRRRDVELSR